jgi:DNA-binding beta-propeller fold protein YncE
VFHRGKHPLMEFDANGKYLRSIADDLFVTPHTVRVDSQDNIWTTDVGAHLVLKLSPEGRVLLSLGRMRTPGDNVLHFNQPTDVAFDREGNIYVADGEGNSRVLKFNKFGNVVGGWGMKGNGPGQFDLPHSIAIDDDLVYVGDREMGASRFSISKAGTFANGKSVTPSASLSRLIILSTCPTQSLAGFLRSTGMGKLWGYWMGQRQTRDVISIRIRLP